jgi:O-Antigen ligase
VGSQARIASLPICNALLPFAFFATALVFLRGGCRRGHAYWSAGILSAFLAVALVQVPTLIELHTPGAVTKTLYILHCGYFALLICCGQRFLSARRMYNLIFIGLITDAVICALQLVGIVTGSSMLTFLMQSELYGEWLVTGAFGNPNNQAVVALMSIVALDFLKTKSNLDIGTSRSGLALFAALFVTLLTLSRLVTALLVLWALVTYRRSLLKPAVLLVVATLLAISIYGFLQYGSDTSVFALDRIASRLGAFSNLTDILANDTSISLRLEIYKRFLDSGTYLPFGLGFNNYGRFFASVPAYESFLSESPHTYVGELLLASGVVGAIAIVMLLALYVVRSIQTQSAAPLAYCGLFLLSSFVPSSLILTPVALLLLFVPLIDFARATHGV